MKILHVEGGRTFFGGPQQLIYLLEASKTQDVTQLIVCPTGAELADKARAKSFHCEEIPFKGDLDIRYVFRLRSFIRKHKVDIVVVHSRKGVDWFSGLAAKLTGIKAILVRRVDNPENPLLCKLKCAMYDRVICISSAIQKVLTNQGINPQKLTVVRDVVDLDVFKPSLNKDSLLSADLRGANTDLIIGVIAQLIIRKGHSDLIDVIPHILEKVPNAKIVFFGKGNQRSALEQKVSELNIESNVIFAGFRDDIADCLPCLDLVVHPARQEGMGVSLLQASAASVPIVAYGAGGVPEVIQNEVTGYLVEVGDKEELAKKIIHLLNRPELCKRFGASGRTKMETEFSPKSMAEAYLTIYQLLAKES